MGNKYKYNAFISYRHISPDKEIADKLQKKLENYKPPKSLFNKKKFGSWRIFRDETELPTSSNLSNDIQTALEESEYLIVICSKTTGESRWCMKEVEYFKELHNGNNSNIITLVSDGNPEDVFPPALCNELIPVTDEFGNTTYQNHVIEPLAANVSGKNLKESLKKLNTEFLRIAAPLLGCGYDNLYNREHKKKIRRIFTIGSIVLSLLLLFAVYNSAMLWKINNQKVALADANKDLQKKTEELNLSNENLRQSNEDLAKKTKEAEDNLAEANRQKKAAEDNLSEAEKQRKIAEQNLEEANRQKKIAEDNLAEVNRQQVIAETNAQEANTQRGVAEENMRAAQENEAKANEANRNLRIKNSEILAAQAKMYLDDDDVFAAIETALDAIPQDGEETPSNIIAENVLTEATGLYNNNKTMLCNKLKLSGYVKFLEFSEDGNSILASDTTGTVYVISYEKNNVMQTYSPLETFGETTGYIKDICVSGNNGYVLCNDQLLSINMADGSINWHYKKDNNHYQSLDKIVTNKNANTVFMSGYSSYIILDKNGAVLSDFEKSNAEYNNSSFYTESFMSANNDVFVFNSEKSVMYYINKDSFKAVPFNITKGNEILSFNENSSCIFINIGLDGSLTFDKAKMMCIDRNTFNVVWETEYTSNCISSSYCNKIIEFEHVIPIKHDEYTDYERKDCVLAISGDEAWAFDKKTGELYYHNKTEYDDRILYCEKNTDSNSLRIATPNAFYPECYLVTAASGLVENDTFLLMGGYAFDQQRKYIAHALPNRYALASDNASEISIYHDTAYDNYTLLKDFPERSGYVDRVADNKAGIVAAYTHDYTDSDTYRNRIVIYDTNNNSLLSDFDVDINVSEMRFADDKLFVVDNYGSAGVYALNGDVIATANLEELFKESAGIDKEYITISFPYLATNQTSILYCCHNGIFVADVSGETIKVNNVLVSSYLDNFCAKDDLISFIKDDYKTSTSKVAYFKTGDTKLSYVKENGTDKEFAKDSITAVKNHLKK